MTSCLLALLPTLLLLVNYKYCLIALAVNNSQQLTPVAHNEPITFHFDAPRKVNSKYRFFIPIYSFVGKKKHVRVGNLKISNPYQVWWWEWARSLTSYPALTMCIESTCSCTSFSFLVPSLTYQSQRNKGKHLGIQGSYAPHVSIFSFHTFFPSVCVCMKEKPILPAIISRMTSAFSLWWIVLRS